MSDEVLFGAMLVLLLLLVGFAASGNPIGIAILGGATFYILAKVYQAVFNTTFAWGAVAAGAVMVFFSVYMR